MIKFLFLVGSLLLCFSALSEEVRIRTVSKSDRVLYFNLGTHTEFFNSVQSDTLGGKRLFEFSPIIGIGTNLPTRFEDWDFLPEVNWVLPKFWEDEEVFKNLFMLRADLGYKLVDRIRLRVGTSLMFLNQHGRGGTVNLNNGNETSKFYYPDENRSSFNNTFDVGGELLFGDLSIRLQTYTYSLFKKESRQISYSLMLSYSLNYGDDL